MSASVAPRFSKLIDLASAPSSDTRRELLREVTDLFFETSEQQTRRESALFDDVLRTVATDLKDDSLVDLAQRLAHQKDGPPGLVRDLSKRSIEVAAPILRHSPILGEDDLLAIVKMHGDGHLRAIAQRETVSATVSDAVARKGDDTTVNVLLANAGASIARGTMEHVVDRAQASPTLHHNLLHRHDVPVDLMNEMYFAVEERLRQVILARNAATDPAELETALAKARERIAKRTDDENADVRAAQARIQDLKRRNALTPSTLIGLYRDHDVTGFLCGLADTTGLDYATTKQIVDRKDMDALAMICRAANMDRPLFVTIAILACGGDQAVGKAEIFGKLYAQVPIEAAQRAMRFYKVRKGVTDAPAL